ncbi:MAG: DNA polymerase II [Pseudomonadales bacterium]|nr:DNA polymerase II [Pseudomonadales bacterium]
MIIEGFLLTRHWREQENGLVLEFWLATDDGPLRVEITGQEGVCFYPRQAQARLQQLLADLAGWRSRPLDLEAFSGQPVAGLYWRRPALLHQIRERCERQSIPLWEADVRTVDRYLSERFIAGDMALETAQPPQAGVVVNPRLRPGRRRVLALRCASLDIETALDGSQLYSIAFHGSGGGRAEVRQVFMLGAAQPAADLSVTWCEDEPQLLQRFLRRFQAEDPDVILGWNVVNFDLRFLQRRCDRWRLPLTLGRGGAPVEWRQARDDRQHYFITVAGRVVLDGIDTLKAATWNFTSFSLEYVARELLGRGKLITHVDQRGAAIAELFRRDKPALARYNLEDCCLVSDIFQAADLLGFAVERSRLTGLPMDKVGGSVAAFENLFLPRLHRAGFVAPNIGEFSSDIAAPGGYVMQSRPGLYRHVLVLDFKSLYPSIIRTFCIDPLSLQVGLREQDLPALVPEVFERSPQAPASADSQWIPGFNGAVFSKHRHLLPQIIETLWQARDQAKRQGNQPLAQAIKIIMNSFYGVLGTPLCRFFDPRLSSSITLRGHDIMLQTRAWIEARGHQVIYGDTDSVFVWLETAVDDATAVSLGRSLAVELTELWQRHLQSIFGLTSRLELEYETHYQRFFMPTVRGSEAGSKKRYCGLVAEPDPATGEPRQRLIFKGLENVRTDWTELARQVQHQVFWRVFHDQSPDMYLQTVVAELYAGHRDQQLVYRKRIRRPLAEYRRNVPPHVQAARKADAWLRQQEQPPRYQRGGWIEYVITLQGPEPVILRSSALDYDHYVQRQVMPAVDGVLQARGTSLAAILRSQLSLF